MTAQRRSPQAGEPGGEGRDQNDGAEPLSTVSLHRPAGTVNAEAIAELKALAHKINCEHRWAQGNLAAGLKHAIRAGELLLEAKAAVGHGAWLTWLEENFVGSQRTARAYMQVASNRQRVANLSFRDALKELAAGIDERQRSQWWQQDLDGLWRRLAQRRLRC